MKMREKIQLIQVFCRITARQYTHFSMKNKIIFTSSIKVFRLPEEIEIKIYCLPKSNSICQTAPRSRIVDERGSDVSEKHYNSGSMIQLKCFVDRVPFPSGQVRWKKGNTILMFNTSIGGIRCVLVLFSNSSSIFTLY